MAGVMARKRLGAMVRQQRTALRLSVRAAAKAAGVDRATWTALEDGSRETQDTKFAGIERVLRWAPGSIDRILEDGQPVLLTDMPSQPVVEVDDTAAIAPTGRPNRAAIISASPEELVNMRQTVEDVLGIDAANEFLRRALEMKQESQSSGGGARSASRDDQAAG